MLLDVLYGVVGVLYHVMQQGGAYRCGAEAYLLTRDFCHRYRVHDIGLTRPASDAFMRFFREIEGSVDDFYFLAVIAFKISFKHLVESVLYHFVLFGCGEFLLGHIR